MKLTPATFILLETLILLPSILFILGIILRIFGNSQLLGLVISQNNLLKNIFVEFISPFAGGFLAYQYLERYKPKGFMALKAKGIIFYSTIVIGLVIFASFIHFG